MNSSVHTDIPSFIIGFLPFFAYVILHDIGLGVEPYVFILMAIISVLCSKGNFKFNLLKWEFIIYLAVVIGIQSFVYTPFDLTYLKGILYLFTAILVANYIIVSIDNRMSSFLKGVIASIILCELYILVFAEARDLQFEGTRRTLEFFSASQVALIASISILWSFARLTDKKSLLYYLVFFLGIVSVFAAFSKSGMVGPFVAIAVYVLSHNKKGIFKYLILGFLLVFILYRIFESSFVEYFDFIEKEKSAPEWDFNGRTSIWEIAILYFLQNPWFGNGYFHCQELLEQFSSLEASQAHSLYYHILMSVGIVGTSAMLLYYIRILYYQRKLLKNTKNWVVIWSNCMCIYFLIRGVTEASIAQCPSVDAFFFVIISLSTIHLYKEDKKNGIVNKKSRKM